MKNCINILSNEQSFPYIIEYSKGMVSADGHNMTDGDDILWHKENNIVRMFEEHTQYYRNKNDWYDASLLYENMVNTYVPAHVRTSNIKVYIPTHAVSTYIKHIKYAITINTWINGVKIDLGTFMFKPADTYAIPSGVVKRGNNEYYDCIDFDIIDPFYLMYSDDWAEFRHLVCDEPTLLNNTGSTLYVSLFVVDEYENRYVIKDGVIGGGTNFNIANLEDYLTLNLSMSNDPHGVRYMLSINNEYDWLLDYLYETYNLSVSHADIVYELILKSKDSIIIGPTMSYTEQHDNCNKDCRYAPNQVMTYSYINAIQRPTDEELANGALDRSGLAAFFSNWLNFEEGWNFVGSLTVYDHEGYELLSLVSNEIPVTQEIFSTFVNGGTKKIIDINDMEINTYNVVNKIENKIVQLEHPHESKTNIMQPVFFRVKELEVLTLHPVVTENISINLDDYKSKVSRFTLLIEGCRFDQIGANSYGILFKVLANKIPESATAGTYYILDENDELVTTGKYSCVR